MVWICLEDNPNKWKWIITAGCLESRSTRKKTERYGDGGYARLQGFFCWCPKHNRLEAKDEKDGPPSCRNNKCLKGKIKNLKYTLF